MLGKWTYSIKIFWQTIVAHCSEKKTEYCEYRDLMPVDDVEEVKGSVLLSLAMHDGDKIYRFSDFGIQSSRNGISFTIKANMGTWSDRVPFIRDCFGIRKITQKECLALQGFPPSFSFPKMPIASAYKQAGNTVVVPVVRKIAHKILASVETAMFDEVLVSL